jgi:hypothetical protein
LATAVARLAGRTPWTANIIDDYYTSYIGFNLYFVALSMILV